MGISEDSEHLRIVAFGVLDAQHNMSTAALHKLVVLGRSPNYS